MASCSWSTGQRGSLTGGIFLRDSDYPLVFARNVQGFGDFIGLAANVGYLIVNKHATTLGGVAWECFITLDGWKHLAELRQIGRTSNQAFVAMWFDHSVDTAWSEGFEPALRDVGYAPVRVDRVQHNGKIDDRIVAEIRRSGLMVADFTGDRGGVYYEAGFAHGLGLPVIYTVRKDYVDRLHFDTRQYNHIVWASSADLRESLSSRIVATLGHGSSGVGDELRVRSAVLDGENRLAR